MAQDILAHIERLKSEWMALLPMDPSHAAKLHQKMRLEWNYNSNHIEGNTLTYGETELLLIFDQTKGDHEFREYEEMKGHDVALKMVEDLAKDKERELTESFICNLNKLLLKEPFYKEAITPDGQPTRRLIKIGEYKSHPNSVRLQNGEMFHYASPAETPAKMHDLLQWYRQAAGDGTHHPITLAAELHYRFVLIHPFDDGNGRISRLLMNYHLLRNDYPPVIIKSADKKNYLRALNEADTGNVPAFVNYVAEQLIWSYDISIKAAKGESVDEVGDWDKEIELLKRSKHPSLVADQKKSLEVLRLTWQYCLSSFFEKLLNSLRKICELFSETEIRLFKDNVGSGKDVYKEDFANKDILNNLFHLITESENGKMADNIQVNFQWTGYKFDGINTFNLRTSVDVFFLLQKYVLKFAADDKKTRERVYKQYLSEDEIDITIEDLKKYILGEIKRHVK